MGQIILVLARKNSRKKLLLHSSCFQLLEGIRKLKEKKRDGAREGNVECVLKRKNCVAYGIKLYSEFLLRWNSASKILTACPLAGNLLKQCKKRPGGFYEGMTKRRSQLNWVRTFAYHKMFIIRITLICGEQCH